MNLSPTIYYYLAGITSNVQTQFTTNTNDIATNTTDIATLQTTVSGLGTYGNITSYTSTGTFTFSGNTNYTFPTQITIPAGTYMIGGYVSYYSTTSQSNPTIICNVAYYIGGSVSQIVDGASWTGTVGNIPTNTVYQINIPMVPFVNATSNSFCMYMFHSFARTFYIYQWSIKAIRIA